MQMSGSQHVDRTARMPGGRWLSLYAVLAYLFLHLPLARKDGSGGGDLL